MANDFSSLEQSEAPKKADIEGHMSSFGALTDRKRSIGAKKERSWDPDIKTEDIFYAYTEKDVKYKLKKIPNISAAGPDGIKKGDIDKRDCHIILAKLFKLLLLHKHFPKEWLNKRTTLIPKTGRHRTNVKNWRPITIGSIISRLFSGLLDRRLRAKIKQCPRQKDFTEENGCYINISTLDSVIRAAKKNGRTIGLADVEKAFDTIPYSIIEQALARKGLSKLIIRYISHM